jgi:hypothetical protein
LRARPIERTHPVERLVYEVNRSVGRKLAPSVLGRLPTCRGSGQDRTVKTFPKRTVAPSLHNDPKLPVRTIIKYAVTRSFIGFTMRFAQGVTHDPPPRPCCRQSQLDRLTADFFRAVSFEEGATPLYENIYGLFISTQFVKTTAGWKISAMAWDDERPGLSIPEHYERAARPR